MIASILRYLDFLDKSLLIRTINFYNMSKRIYITRKRLSEKPKVAFTNYTVFTLDFCIYD